MIKALLLIFAPEWAWDRTFRAQRNMLSVLVGFLLPLLILTSIAECFRLVHPGWGMLQGEVSHRRIFTMGQAIIFEFFQLFLSLLVVFAGSWMVKGVGETFHGRHTYPQTFATVAFGLSPLFLMRLLDMFKDVSPWFGWGIGILLSIRVLYSGVPRMMQPDPAHAFGLFVMSALLLLITTGL